VIHLILSQHPDGDEEQAKRKRYMLKCVFEQGNIDEALKLVERRDVSVISIIDVVEIGEVDTDDSQEDTTSVL
jgi:hypothetical protein